MSTHGNRREGQRCDRAGRYCMHVPWQRSKKQHQQTHMRVHYSTAIFYIIFDIDIRFDIFVTVGYQDGGGCVYYSRTILCYGAASSKQTRWQLEHE